MRNGHQGHRQNGMDIMDMTAKWEKRWGISSADSGSQTREPLTDVLRSRWPGTESMTSDPWLSVSGWATAYEPQTSVHGFS